MNIDDIEKAGDIRLGQHSVDIEIIKKSGHVRLGNVSIDAGCKLQNNASINMALKDFEAELRDSDRGDFWGRGKNNGRLSLSEVKSYVEKKGFIFSKNQERDIRFLGGKDGLLIKEIVEEVREFLSALDSNKDGSLTPVELSRQGASDIKSRDR